MIWLRRAYLFYGAIIFVGSFLVLFPFFWLCINVKPLRQGVVFLNQIWCWVFFPGILMPVITVNAGKNIPKGTAMFIANHASYLDISMLTWVLRRLVAFMGKASINKVPLFGYYFTKLHISVDRKNAQDRNKALDRAAETLQEGRSVVIFPEGRITLENAPLMGHFRDGAFRAAIRAQVPIVPISIAYNWYIMPDWGNYGARWKPAVIVIHEPIDTTGMTEEADTERLKQQCYDIMEAELIKRNPVEAQRLLAKRAKHARA